MGNCLSKEGGGCLWSPEYPAHSGNLNVISDYRSEYPERSINVDPVSDSLPVLSTSSDLVIGIDFGTTFSGVAYAHAAGIGPATSTAEMRKAADKVSVIKTWPNQSNYYTEKTPSVLAYNKNPPMWGGNVRHTFEPRVAHFKLGLQENISSHYKHPSFQVTQPASVLGGFLSDHSWRHPALPEKKAVDYVGDYLTCINQYVTKEVLPTRFGERFLRNQKLSYVITVPAIWSDKAKEQTRQAAYAAGIKAGDLTLITEPEAAAIYCAALCDELDLEPGDRFMICDAGGGTVVFYLLDCEMLISRILLLIKW
jgi:hypothetical protein